jgi:hypothetical protein
MQKKILLPALLLIAIVLGYIPDRLSAQENLIHFWVFDRDLPNDTPLTAIESRFSVMENGLLTYHSALEGYPFDEDHPNWRKASMERRNAPTPLNYRPNGNNGIPFDQANMRAIQIKQPFTGDGGENTLYFELPTSGFENIVFSFAAIDEGAADALLIDYNVEASGTNFTSEGLTQTSFNLGIFYQLYQIDFSSIIETRNNPHFRVRIRFAGSDMGAEEGNRVTFNNFALDGQVMSGVNLPPEVIGSVPFQEMIEEADDLTIDLLTLFTDPENEPLTFSTLSTNPALVSTMIDGNILTINPVQRGESTITLTASDGHNESVEIEFRVLVYPKPLDLSIFSNPDHSFSFDYWDPNEPDYSYPEHMIFLQSDKSDPKQDDPLEHAYFIPHDDYHEDDFSSIGFPYNNSRRSRINGLAEGGISFINTGRSRDVGGLLLAIGMPATKSPSWEIKWTASTLAANERTYALRLMYRYSIEDEFADWSPADPMVYVSAESGHSAEFTWYPLFGEFVDPYIQLLWKYYHVEGDSGPRAEIRLDDISIRLLVGMDEQSATKPTILSDGQTIWINYTGHHQATVQLFNLTGQIMFSSELEIRDKVSIIPELQQGIYLLNIKTDSGIFTEKVRIR